MPHGALVSRVVPDCERSAPGVVLGLSSPSVWSSETRRVTVYLPTALAARLEEEAKLEHNSLGALLRRVIVAGCRALGIAE